MKNDNNKNIIIALLVFIIVILGALVVLFATDKINFNSDEVNNVNYNENIDKEDSDVDVIQIANNYIGEWYLYENADYLKINNISNNQIIFDWFIYRIDMYENVVATINSSNTAVFKSTDDLGAHEIEGKLTFEENTIKVEVLKVTEPETTSINEGYTIIFNKKKQNNNAVTNSWTSYLLSLHLLDAKITRVRSKDLGDNEDLNKTITISKEELKTLLSKLENNNLLKTYSQGRGGPDRDHLVVSYEYNDEKYEFEIFGGSISVDKLDDNFKSLLNNNNYEEKNIEYKDTEGSFYFYTIDEYSESIFDEYFNCI